MAHKRRLAVMASVLGCALSVWSKKKFDQSTTAGSLVSVAEVGGAGRKGREMSAGEEREVEKLKNAIKQVWHAVP
jgi:hypothetical protein